MGSRVGVTIECLMVLDISITSVFSIIVSGASYVRCGFMSSCVARGVMSFMNLTMLMFIAVDVASFIVAISVSV